MRLVPVITGLTATAAGVVAAATRRLDHDATQWHVDPLSAPKPSTPNSYRVVPADSVRDVDADAASKKYEMPAAALGAAFDRIVRSSGNVEVVGGTLEGGFITYVQTSKIFAFPDYISVKFIEVDDQNSTLAVFSRSRFGRSDLGVNKKRITAWLERLG